MRIGIIGCGGIANVHGPIISNFPGAELVGVVRRNPLQTTACSNGCRIAQIVRRWISSSERGVLPQAAEDQSCDHRSAPEGTSTPRA